VKPESVTEPMRAALHRVRAAVGDDLSHFPDFLIIGPQRTGTTWLYHNLRQHPDLFFPRDKEVYFFSNLGRPENARYISDDLADYTRLFSDTLGTRIRWNAHALMKFGRLYRPLRRGEATASYATLSPEVISDICLLNPAVKAILMLRDPVERVWSHAKKDLGGKTENFDIGAFEKFVGKSGQRQKAGYRAMIDEWSAKLAPDHLFLGDFRQVSEDPAALLVALYRFLGVDPDPRFVSGKAGQAINATSDAGIPPEARALVETGIADEIDDFRKVLAEVQESGNVR
jgi:hypothetical protein